MKAGLRSLPRVQSAPTAFSAARYEAGSSSRHFMTTQARFSVAPKGRFLSGSA